MERKSVLDAVNKWTTILPELANIVVEFAIGKRFYTLCQDDGAVDDEQKSIFIANPITYSTGGFDPTQVKLVESTENRLTNGLSDRIVVSGVKSTRWDNPIVFYDSTLLKMYIVSSNHVYVEDAHGGYIVWNSITFYDPILNSSEFIGRTDLVGTSTAACYVPRFQSIVWVGGFGSNRVTVYHIPLNHWSYRGYSRYRYDKSGETDDSSVVNLDNKPLVIPCLPTSRHSCALIHIHDSLYVIAGTAGNNSEHFDHCLQWNLSGGLNNKWEKFNCPFDGTCFGHVWDTCRFVVVASKNRSFDHQLFYVYNIISKQWTTMPIASFNENNITTALSAFNGKLYATVVVPYVKPRRLSLNKLVMYDEPSCTWMPVVERAEENHSILIDATSLVIV